MTNSMAALCIASAPNRPCPINVSGSLWYTDASVESSVSRFSSNAGGSDWIVDVMLGFSASTTFYRVLENRHRRS